MPDIISRALLLNYNTLQNFAGYIAYCQQPVLVKQNCHTNIIRCGYTFHRTV